jgi:HEPN domain-containing protein
VRLAGERMGVRANDFNQGPARHRPGRLRDAQVLLKAKRLDGAFYLSGYAVELALKARICRTLKWREFPQSGREFEDFKSLRTHDLEVLRKFSGIEERVTAKALREWSVVTKWNPEKRYQAIGMLKPLEASEMVKYVERLLEVL